MKRTICIISACAICAFVAAPLAACAPQNDEQSSIYRITAQYDGGNALTGRVELDYFNDTDNALDSLCFNLWGNAYRQGAQYAPVSAEMNAQAYYNGESYGGMTITDAAGGQWQVRGEDENILEIALESPIYPDERAQVTIDYTLTLADVNHRTGVTENTVNLGNFFPILCAYGQAGWLEYTYCATGDPFVSDVADYEMQLTVPESFKVAASAQLCGSAESGGVVTYTYRMQNARDCAFVLSEQFEEISREVNGVEVKYYYYDDEQAQVVLGAAANSLEYFSQTFGAYPYPTYTVVQTGFCQGGMEYPALSMISDECEGQTAIYTAVHETAHQWWYAAVGSDQYAHGWQDEGLAEYCSLMFFEYAPQYGVTSAGLLGTATKAYRAYFSVYNQLFGDADTSMERALNEFSGDYEYANIAYNKGLLMFDAVRAACGDDHFTAALKDYYTSYLNKIAPCEGLIAAFCRYADCEGIFNSFLSGEVII